jgi:hypothetical protein
MSPKIGRPTEDPKKARVGFRLTEDESAMIDYCYEVFGITKTEVIRQGIKEMYQKAREEAKKK